jgi:serine/threonine protein kinase
MSLERTQHQTTEELRKAQELSLAPSRPPAQVAGYQLLKFLGSGAYGEVWSAKDLKTGRVVAIKFYTRRSSADVQLLASEVQKLVVLAADRYVVQLLDVGWNADPPYYVMDYIEHGSLEDRLKERVAIPASEAIELFQELANGLMHLHGKGILHCDLKPGNVMLDQDGKPRVADFGQSRLSTEETGALGTLFYMAPEQADLDAAPDARWDVYGLGALLFSMLTGRPPYYSAELAKEIDSFDEVRSRLGAYRNGLSAAPKPNEHRAIPGVDRALAEIIDRCIAVNPKKRFSNVQSLLLALRQRELTKARRPLMVLGLIGPLLLIGVMSLFGWWAFRQSVDSTLLEITKKANESNQFAAKLAARSAAEQIDEYFRVVKQLSRNQEFLAAFESVVEDTELLEMRVAIADPDKNGKGPDDPNDRLAGVREDFRNHQKVRSLHERFLEPRLFDATGEFPPAASWFVTDRFGNQIASVFRRENKTVANNYAYRTYFTGRNRDLKFGSLSGGENHGEDILPVSDQLETREIIQRPHLSAVFISEQSNTWKVAFSAPLFLDQAVVGVVAVTVDLGSFVDFDNFKEHYAMMIDTRDGENPGIILEHPLFERVLKEQGKIPESLARLKVDWGNFGAQEQFVDPVSTTEIGKLANYDRKLIVATAPVMMDAVQDAQPTTVGESAATSEGSRVDTGFLVLAVEDYVSVVDPANDLSRRLGRLALGAGLFLSFVTVAMGFIVKRMLQESRQKLERAFSPSAETSFTAKTVESMETMAATDQGNQKTH